MSNSELTIFVGELLGVPKVSLSGTLQSCYEQAVVGILNGFKDQGVSTLVLDLAGLSMTQVDGLAAILKSLRSMGTGICIHIVAQSAVCGILDKAGIGPTVRTYCSLDEISQAFPQETEYLTSRWMASSSEDSELPMAA